MHWRAIVRGRQLDPSYQLLNWIVSQPWSQLQDFDQKYLAQKNTMSFLMIESIFARVMQMQMLSFLPCHLPGKWEDTRGKPPLKSAHLFEFCPNSFWIELNILLLRLKLVDQLQWGLAAQLEKRADSACCDVFCQWTHRYWFLAFCFENLHIRWVNRHPVSLWGGQTCFLSWWYFTRFWGTFRIIASVLQGDPTRLSQVIFFWRTKNFQKVP